MEKIRQLLKDGYKVSFVPIDNEIFQVIVVNTASKERGYVNKAMFYEDKKNPAPFEKRLSDFLDARIEESKAAEKLHREKYAKPKEENV